jgi:hypothetical protein
MVGSPVLLAGCGELVMFGLSIGAAN